MRIFSLNILTNKQLKKIEENSYKEGKAWILLEFRDSMVRHLLYLRKDHWDKNYFDRLIEWLVNVI